MSDKLVCPYWCCETFSIDGKTSSWNPVKQDDHQLLEAAHSSQEKEVYVEGRRTRADLVKNTLHNCFEFSKVTSASGRPDRRLIRAMWFYKDATVVPFTEEVGQKIEEWFQSIKDGKPKSDAPFTSEIEIDVVLNNDRNGDVVKYKVVAVKEVERERRGTQGQRLGPAPSKSKINGFSITMYPSSSTILKLGSLTLQRGVSPPPQLPEDNWEKIPQDHLVLVVHGIGQYYFANTDDSFDVCITSLRKNLMEQRCALDTEDGEYARKECAATGSDNEAGKQEEDSCRRFECFGVQWFNEVHDDPRIGLHSGLEKVTLPSILSMRKLAHEVALDVLLYLTPEFRQKILRIVVEKINLMYIQFSELNPHFVKEGGKCSIVGHSLGTVIVYDILSMQSNPQLPPDLKLTFDPIAFFSLGSPLGMFLTVRKSTTMVHDDGHSLEKASSESQVLVDDILNSTYSFPTCKQFFNIFNRNDPVAYRLEPMAEPSLQEKDPMIVPHHDGGLRAQYLIKSVASSITETWKSFSSPAGWFKSAPATAALQTTTVEENVDTSLKLTDGMTKFRSLQLQSSRQRCLKICPPNGIPDVRVNSGRRFDYLLQESALEAANEFISSLTSHTSYFEQKDVARFIAAILM